MNRLLRKRCGGGKSAPGRGIHAFGRDFDTDSIANGYNKFLALAAVFILGVMPDTALAVCQVPTLDSRNPELMRIYANLGTFQYQLGLFLLYMVGYYCAVEEKKPVGNAILIVLGYAFTSVVTLALLIWGGVMLKEHWIWKGVLVPALYISGIAVFMALWSSKVAWWGGAVVTIIALMLTGVRMGFVC